MPTKNAINRHEVRYSATRRHFPEDALDAVEFGLALRAARGDAGLSMKRAAARIGVSHNALGSWELGQRRKRLPRRRVEQLEEVYGIDDRRLLRAGGYVSEYGVSEYGVSEYGVSEYVVSGHGASRPDPATPRRSLSYGGAPLTAEEEQQVRTYIEFLRSQRSAD